MVATATVRVMSPEEIASRAGGEAPFARRPERATVFAERAMRLRQKAAGHAMADYLQFIAELAQAQQRWLAQMPALPLPGTDDQADALARAAARGQPPVPAADWPLDPAWRAVLRALVADLLPKAPAGARPALERLAAADEVYLDRQADALLQGVSTGLDMAGAPIVAAALQVMWVHVASTLPEPARTDDATLCPTCGSTPVASITRTQGGAIGQRYLHCSLCSTEWHLPRKRCPHCLSDKSLAYQSLDAADGDGSAAAQAALQAETCDECNHYLKVLHTDRDPMADPVADDLASLTLDLLVSETGKRRHGQNLMLLFAETPPDPPDPPDTSGAP